MLYLQAHKATGASPSSWVPYETISAIS